MKIGLFSDAHGNINACKAVVEAMKANECDYIISLGDAIAIGPYPKKTLDYLISENITMIKGNHELYYLMEEKNLKKQVAFDGEYIHQMWVKNRLGHSYFNVIQDMPMSLSMNIEGHQIYFAHYAFKNTWYQPFKDNPNADELYDLFQRNDDLIAFGHHHPQFDLYDKLRDVHYVNPGSCGCTFSDFAPYCILDLCRNAIKVSYLQAPYNRQEMIEAIKERDIEGDDFILKAFFNVKE